MCGVRNRCRWRANDLCNVQHRMDRAEQFSLNKYLQSIVVCTVHTVHFTIISVQSSSTLTHNPMEIDFHSNAFRDSHQIVLFIFVQSTKFFGTPASSIHQPYTHTHTYTQRHTEDTQTSLLNVLVLARITQIIV